MGARCGGVWGEQWGADEWDALNGVPEAAREGHGPDAGNAGGKEGTLAGGGGEARRWGAVQCVGSNGVIRGRNYSGMNLVFVSAEVAPWSKTGGFGNVVGDLPPAVISQPFSSSKHSHC